MEQIERDLELLEDRVRDIEREVEYPTRISVGFKRLTETAKLPKFATASAAGMDLYADEDYSLIPGEYRPISTGLSMELPNNTEAQIRPRSGLAAKFGVTVLNAPGTIDSDYRGEVKVLLINHSRDIFKITKGDRIGQMVISKTYNINTYKTTELSETQRGQGGFGSTGTT